MAAFAPGNLVTTVSGAARIATDFGLTAVGRCRPRRSTGRADPTVKRIAFQAYSPHLAQVFRSTIARLRDNDAVDASFDIVIHPQMPLRQIAELGRYAREDLGLPESAVKHHWQVVNEGFDLLVCTDVYARFPPRARRRWLIPHGPGLGSRFFESRLLRKTVFDFDLIAVNGPYDLELVRNAGPERGHPRAVAVGYPFLDDVQSANGGREQFCRSRGLDPDRPLVVYAPHWRALNTAGAHERTQVVVDALVRAGVSVLVKPHACSLNRAMSNNVDWRSRLEPMAIAGRVHADFDVDDSGMLQHTDALVTDVSSRAFNAMLMGIPVTLVAPQGIVDPNDAFDAARLQLLLDGAHLAATPAKITELLAPDGPGWQQAPGAAAVAERCFSNVGHATESFVQLIGSELGIDVGTHALAVAR